MLPSRSFLSLRCHALWVALDTKRFASNNSDTCHTLLSPKQPSSVQSDDYEDTIFLLLCIRWLNFLFWRRTLVWSVCGTTEWPIHLISFRFIPWLSACFSFLFKFFSVCAPMPWISTFCHVRNYCKHPLAHTISLAWPLQHCSWFALVPWFNSFSFGIQSK